MMKRWFVAAGLTSTLVLVPVRGATAAPIGTFSLFEDFFGVSLDVANSSTDLVFSNLSVAFCDGSVVPGGGAAPFLMGDGSVRTCSGTLEVVAGFGTDPVEPGNGVQFVDFIPSTAQFAFLSMSVTNASGATIPFGVDALDLSCQPSQQGCTNFIYPLDTTRVPEPSLLVLLAAGLGAMTGRRFLAKLPRGEPAGRE